MDFFWVEKQQLAGGSLPKNKEDINILLNRNIQHIISLADCNKVNELLHTAAIKHHCIEIPDFDVPTTEQIIKFLDTITTYKATEPIFVHCYAGCGRTGTMLALYMVNQGKKPFHAIQAIRTIRACSLETAKQENMILEYYEFLQSQKTEQRS